MTKVFVVYFTIPFLKEMEEIFFNEEEAKDYCEIENIRIEEKNKNRKWRDRDRTRYEYEAKEVTPNSGFI